MVGKMKARSTNRLATSPAYSKILYEYNRQFQETAGRMSDKKFYENFVATEVKNYGLAAWYGFLKRFKSQATGLLPIEVSDSTKIIGTDQEAALSKTIRSNEIATQEGISHALNLGAEFYKMLWKKYQEDPESLTDFEKKIFADAMFKAMKAQDSRIHALGKVRQDNRDQARFERAFGEAAYE